LSDRAVVALVLAFAAAFGLAEPAIMLLALAMITLEAAELAGSRG
jgi:hypothetical protein